MFSQVNYEDLPEIVVEELEELHIYSAGCASSWSCIGSRSLATGKPVQLDDAETTDASY